MTIHLAPVGHRYELVTPSGRPPFVRAVGKTYDGRETLCGARAPESAVKVALPFEHPEGCQECIAKFPERPTDRLQPVMWRD